MLSVYYATLKRLVRGESVNALLMQTIYEFSTKDSPGSLIPFTRRMPHTWKFSTHPRDSRFYLRSVLFLADFFDAQKKFHFLSRYESRSLSRFALSSMTTLPLLRRLTPPAKCYAEFSFAKLLVHRQFNVAASNS
jgi:hypothetical protein